MCFLLTSKLIYVMFQTAAQGKKIESLTKPWILYQSLWTDEQLNTLRTKLSPEEIEACRNWNEFQFLSPRQIQEEYIDSKSKSTKSSLDIIYNHNFIDTDEFVGPNPFIVEVEIHPEVISLASKC